MACHYNDNVYTQIFTPREYQVELLDAAKEHNTVLCSSKSSTKTFITIKLLQELSFELRSKCGKRAIFILDEANVGVMSSHIKLLTDLKVANFIETEDDFHTWAETFKSNSVLLTTVETCCNLILNGYLIIENINLIVIDDCLYGEKQQLLEPLMTEYRRTSEKPRILGLAADLLGSELLPDCLEDELQRLEKLLNCSVNTSSELVTLLRFCCHPKQRLIEYSKTNCLPLGEQIRRIIVEADEFLSDHRFDPSEIYSDEFLEELSQLPNPIEQPRILLKHILEILTDLGPWAADQAALNLLTTIEKLKVKVPYERHYLLLCMVSTMMVKIRAICDAEFMELSDLDRIKKFSTSKVLRFLEILKQFKPSGERPPEVVETPEAATNLLYTTKSGRGKNIRGPRRPFSLRPQQEDSLCALVFVQNRYTAKIIFTLLYTVSQHDKDFWWISPLYSVEKIANPLKEPREAEAEHRRQEEVLRKYRMHDCNIMVSTSVLEQGCDLPKCNLVIRFDIPLTFHSYVQSKARARATDAHYLLMVNEFELDTFVANLAEYMEVEKTLLRRCRGSEPDEKQEFEADCYSSSGPVYKPSSDNDAPALTLSTAITLVNRYCAKLPSDTFTRLTPLWTVTQLNGDFLCTLRLPINSPIKQNICGSSSINSLLACRIAAYRTCQHLHQMGELDDNLQPIGKENFKANEDWNNLVLESVDEALTKDNIEPRPGTTKRRQYYYKRIAEALTDCLPKAGVPTYFYKIVLTLTCPLPEEQNTRGRKIYPPEESVQGFGILTSKPIPKICAFPIFTRSGEVSVDLELCSDSLILTPQQVERIGEFLNYTFASVLRLQRYLMLFDLNASENCYLIAPTRDEPNGTTIVDWAFVDLIYQNRAVLPEIVLEEERTNFVFYPLHYKDAVVMPWYRNQDQPQYFYVAEICHNLNPGSNFPGSEYATFEEYYLRKYDIQIQNSDQDLLDVDHTSARLNFLTPRYVNRKGVALPTSSEETKRAKRENLEQKQILVPELCATHPFPASLWRQAVSLPCILYRINALLLADQIRRRVAEELHLGKINLQNGFKWPSLNFGWNLSDVLKKTKELEMKKLEAKSLIIIDPPTEIMEIVEQKDKEIIAEIENEVPKNEGEEEKGWVEIGTWSNDMIDLRGCDSEVAVRYASPTSWLNLTYDDFSDSDESYSLDEDSDCGGLKIEFMGDNTAEAVEQDVEIIDDSHMLTLTNFWDGLKSNQRSRELTEEFHKACELNKKLLLSNKVLFRKTEEYEKSDKQVNKLAKERINVNVKVDWDAACASVKSTRSVCDKILAKRKDVLNNDESMTFSFDAQPNLLEHPGPSPSVILQALTMSNANDGINLERLETIGDSFLKYAITNYLYSKYENVHEGKLSHLRSKQVSNLNLYRLGKSKALGECMIATKFDPHDNWLPPCYYVPKKLEEALMDARVPANYWTPADVAATRDMTIDEICQMVREHGEALDIPSIIPYNLVTQHSIPDKSIADCVEALIGSYLIDCGPRGALLFMAWLGMRVLPQNPDGSYGELELPRTPLLRHVPNPELELHILLDGYDKFEDSIGYHFQDRAYLLQALTHASYSPNTVTDCYQRLEFLGDAVLDYLITRHLYEDKRMHSPGALTDLRSALVNNTIFASLAVRHGFHRYFRHLSPGLHEVVERFVRIQEESGHTLVEELYLIAEHECEEVEDVEVPKALGDVFESVAGAIFLDSGMSLDAVWKVYYQMMSKEIEKFSDHVPKSPIRELLELEPETAKFGKPEKLADGRRVRVTVEVFGKGVFKGIGRNYRIAKCTAAKCALKYLKRRGLLKRY